MILIAHVLPIVMALAHEPTARPDLPTVQATLTHGRDVIVTMKIINPLPDAIVLLSVDRPNFIADAKECFMTVSSVVTSDLLEHAFTPSLTRVESKGSWTAAVTVPRDLLNRGKCRNWTFQIQLAYLTVEDASASRLSRDAVIRQQ